MKINFFYCGILFCLCAVISVNGQNNLRDGYIVKHSQDTVFGQVDLRTNSKNYLSCVFSAGGSVSEYGPSQIRGYGFKGGKFYSSAVIDSAFVEVLLLGRINLYKYEEGYFASKNDQLFFLESKEIVVMMDGKDYHKRDQRWRGIISAMVGDCLPTTDGLLSRVDFNERSITNLIKKYNQCTGEEVVEFKADIPWTTIQLAAEAGLTYSVLSITDNAAQSDMPDKYMAFHPSIGIKAIFSFPRISERFGLFTGLDYIPVNFTGERSYTPQGGRNTYTSDISLRVLSMPTGLRYKTPEKSVSWLFMAGLALDIHLGSDSKMNAERVTNNEVTYDPERYVFLIEDSQTGFWGGAGISKTFRKFKAELLLRYTTMGDMTSSIGKGAYHKRTSLSVLIIL